MVVSIIFIMTNIKSGLIMKTGINYLIDMLSTRANKAWKNKKYCRYKGK